MKPLTVARLALLSAIWGGSFLFIKVAVEGMHPTLVAFGRIVIGAVAVVGWAALRRTTVPAGAAAWSSLAVMAVLANMIPFTAIAAAEREITSALASVLNATTPLMTALASVLLLRTETMSRVRATGIAIGFAGVATIVLPGAELGGTVSGSLLMLLATACYGVAGAFAKRYLRMDPLQSAAGQLLLASVGMSVVAAVAAPGAPFELTAPRALAVLALGALGTGYGWVLYLRLIADEGATTASLVTYLVPFVSVVAGRVVLGETLRPNAYLGGLIVIVGIAVAQGRVRRGQRTPAPDVARRKTQ